MSFVVAIITFISRSFRLWKRRLLVKYFYTNSIWKRFSTQITVGLLILSILITIALLALFLHRSRNKYVRELKFKVGWWKTAVMSVPILDEKGQVNFPQKILKRIDEENKAEDTLIQSYLNKDHHNERNYNDSVIWKVDGLTKYVDTISDLQIELGHSANLSSPRNSFNEKEAGFWLFSFGTKNGDDDNRKRPWVASAIRGFKITEHLVQQNSDISAEDLEVAIAIKAYVEGEAGIVIRYEDSLSKKFHLDEIEKNEFKQKGFCYKILDVPFDKRINMVYIRPTSTNLREEGLVIIDQIIVVVSSRNVTESIMHTLVPTNWC